MTIDERIMNVLHLSHPRSRDEVYAMVERTPNLDPVPTREEFDAAIQRLFEAQAIVLCSAPSEPIQLGADPVHATVDWLDLHPESQ